MNNCVYVRQRAMYRERRPGYTEICSTPYCNNSINALRSRAGARSIRLLVFGVFAIIIGTITTAVAYRKPSPPFDKPFFIQSDADDPMRIIGPVFLGIGLLFLLLSIIPMIANGQQEWMQQGNSQIRTQAPIQPSSVYPQQLRSQYSPPSHSYQQSVPANANCSQQNDFTSPPPPYDSIYGVKPSTTANISLQNPCENNSSTDVLPSAPAFSISGPIHHW